MTGTSIFTNKKLGILGIGLGETLTTINFSIVSTALSTIQNELHASFLELQWMMNIFGVFTCVLLVIMGRLSDTYGRKRLFLSSLIGVGIASLIAGCARYPSWIIFAEMIQGISGAVLLAGSQALMSQLFPAEQRSRAIGIWATIAGISLGVGPLLSGAIIHFFGWRFIFFMNIPLVIIALAFVTFFVSESKSTEHCGKIDYYGTFFLMLSIGALMLGVIQGPTWGWISPWSLLCLLTFIVSVAFFVCIEIKTPVPIVNFNFFAKRIFLLPSFISFCIIFSVWAVFFILPLYMQNSRGDSAFLTGLLMLFATGPVALLSSHVSHWYEKIGGKILMSIGFCFFILSAILQFNLQIESQLTYIILISLTFGLGWVLAWGPATTTAISSIPKDVASLASGAFTTIQELGACIGLSITGTVFRSIKPTFMAGYQHSIWVLLIIAIVGLILSLCLPNKNLTQNSITH